MKGEYAHIGVNTTQIIHNQRKHTDQYNSGRDRLNYDNLDVARTLKSIGRRKLQPATPEGLFESAALGLGLDPKEVKKYFTDNAVTGKLAKNEAAMASVDMLLKYVLLLGGIAIATTTLSGCVDVDAPSIMDHPEKYLGKNIDTAYQEVRGSTAHDEDVGTTEFRKSPEYNAIIEKKDAEIKVIQLTDKTGKIVQFINNDADPQIDQITENGEVIADENDLKPDEGTPAGNNPDEVYKLIRNGNFDKATAENLLGQDVSSLKITGDLGPTPFEPQENAPYVLEYKSDEFKERFGLEKYKEYYDENGQLTGISINKDPNNGILAADDVQNANEFIDGKISRIKGGINGEAFMVLEE